MVLTGPFPMYILISAVQCIWKVRKTKFLQFFPSSLLSRYCQFTEYQMDTKQVRDSALGSIHLLEPYENHLEIFKKNLVYNSTVCGNSFFLQPYVDPLFVLTLHKRNFMQLQTKTSWHLHALLIAFCSFRSHISGSLWSAFQLKVGDIIKIRLCLFLLRWYSFYTQVLLYGSRKAKERC